MAEGQKTLFSFDLPLAISLPTQSGVAHASSSEKSADLALLHLASQSTLGANRVKNIVGVGSSFLKMFVGNDGDFMFLPRGYTVEPENLSLHWVTITAPSGSVYQVWMESYQGSPVFRSGWSDLMDRELVDQGDIRVFTRTAPMDFTLTIMTRGGMQKAPALVNAEPNLLIRPSKPARWQDVKFFRNKGVKPSHNLVDTLYSLWVTSKNPFILYATLIKPSAITNGTVLLSRDVSSKLPAGPARITLLFDGNPIVYQATIVKRGDGHAKITAGWLHFVRAHNLRPTILYVFKFEIRNVGWQATLYQV